jgi:hypothetical protein
MDDTQTTTPGAPQPDLASVQHRYQMLLDRWHRAEPRSLRVEIIQVPSSENGNIAIVRAIAETAAGTFAAFGSADAPMAGSDRAVVLLEWAELLAKSSALRDACNAAAAAFGFEQPMSPASPAQPTLPTPRGPIYSAAVVENGRLMTGALGQPLASMARATSAGGRTNTPSAAGQTSESSPTQVMSSFLSRLIARMQTGGRAITAGELLDPMTILREQQTVTFNAGGQALEQAGSALLDALARNQTGAIVYAGMQRLSRMKAFEARYRALLETADRVYVFGIDDFPVWHHPKLQVIRLKPPAGSGLDRFWYILCSNEQVRTVLLAEQVGAAADSNLTHAQYKGFWTFEPQATKEAATILDQATALLR